ncbi:protein-L-isoaspartate O-methyltransferase family protein [Streptomyces millisiae]|uniref:Protein-L-isoaspartate O-methyltransferase n=1 Tax=Streptomyces millisiae TaxID=3075542 RepID=A0ABU2LW90_9ACTN|nr:hypothetical protein [Streptomyces sp. DSM 44918]MDT0321865.1 hypothetical protein [Streptomyces sp. DSM 44918]
MTASDSAWQTRAQHLVDDLRARGEIRSDAIAQAMATVPRHRFITGYYNGAQRIPVTPNAPSPDLLERAYSNTGIMVHLPSDPAGTPSSSSQPAVMARMLEAARLAPGMRVMEIGAGTGWNAALIAHITGEPVSSIEASPVIAAETRASLARNAIAVTVRCGDGYHGAPDDGPFDRILVTCGIAGISPHWLAQLAPGGTIVAPLAHGGLHPLAVITETTARLVAFADFMPATGPLYAGARPAATRLPRPATTTIPIPALNPQTTYRDLWMYLAAHDPRTTCAAAHGTSNYSGCAVVDPTTTAAVFVRPDHLAPIPGDASPALAATTHRHIARWRALGEPPLTTLSSQLRTTGSPSHPIFAPNAWALDAPTEPAPEQPGAPDSPVSRSAAQ